jgi:hypothetical protein
LNRNEHRAKAPSRRTGLFARIFAPPRSTGTTAPAGFRVPAVLCGLALALAATLLLGATSASAAAPTLTAPAAFEVGFTSAKISAEVNPEAGPAATSWHFEYSETPEGEESWVGFGGATIEPPASEESSPVAVTSNLEGLAPNHTYLVRLIADNEAHAETPAPYPTFTTKAATAPILAVKAPEASYVTAHLAATINPEGGNVNPLGPTTLPIAWQLQFALASEPENWQLAGASTIAGTEAEASAPIEVSALAGDGTFSGPLQPATAYTTRLLVTYAGSETVIAPEEPGFETLPVAAPAVSIDPITTFTATTAHLTGTVNPEGADPAFNSACRFDYVTQAGWVEGGETFAAASSIPCEPETVEGTGAQEVKADLTGLTPHTTYHLRLVASNAGGTSEAIAVETLTTQVQAPLISNTSSTDVTADSADLRAQIDPGGAPTTYHFEYDTSPYTTGAPHGQSTPESPSIGADNSLHPATAAIQGLQPDTTYHYRIVATNSQSPAGGTLGPDRTFTTEPTGGEFALPDARAYELVSPPQKDGAQVLGIGGGGVTAPGGDATEASEDGTSVTYIASAPVGANPPGNTISSQMFSTRGAGGWSSLNIATPHKHSVEGLGGYHGEEYQRFSPDLSHALLVPRFIALEPPLAPEIHQEVGGETEIYLRDNATNMFRAVVTSEPLPAVNFEGATPDLSHVVFGGPAGLDPNYPSAEGLYEWADGQTRLVSVLPDHEPASGHPLRSTEELFFEEESRILLGSSVLTARPDVSATRHAISDDGTRIVWNEEDERLFTRDMATGETLQVDAVQSGGGAAGGGAFKVASSDGSRVFFTDGNALVTGAHGGDLYMFEPARPEGERLTDLTLGVAGAESGGVNVLEANEAGTSIYVRTLGILTSAPNSEGESATPCTETEQRPGGETVPSACNLYLLRESSAGGGAWSVTFVAGGAEAAPSLGSAGFGARETLQRQAARVSPSGRYLAFMSRRSLTGYDNRDAISGEPDEEVYSYDAETNRLVCASCNPSGARPVGQYMTDTEEIPAMDPVLTWKGRWVAAVIPGWTQNGAFRSTGHQPRYLNDSGRLFFTSSDALVPRDVNGRDDVYEYDPVGVGRCQPPSYGQGASVVFNETLGGCIGLISAGTGNTDSAFFDASASGNDVFFTTQDGLVSQDKDGTADMYDARVCTQAEPCPSSLAVSPACTTTDSCRVAPSPQPGISTGPASATFAGAGNVKQCPKGKVKRSGKCVAKKSNKHKKSHKKNKKGKRAASHNRGGGK